MPKTVNRRALPKSSTPKPSPSSELRNVRFDALTELEEALRAELAARWPSLAAAIMATTTPMFAFFGTQIGDQHDRAYKAFVTNKWKE